MNSKLIHKLLPASAVIRCSGKRLLIASLFWGPFFASESVIAEPQQIKVGVILPLSGAFARYGETVRSALEKDVPQNVKLIVEDEGCDAARALTAYKKLKSIDGVHYIIGPWCGSPQLAVAPFLASDKVLSILGSSAPVEVFARSKGRMYSAHHSVESESEFMADQIYNRGARKVAILFLDNLFSRAHENVFRKRFKGEVLDTLTYSQADGSELRALALKVKTLNPDALYIPDAYPILHGFLKELQVIGWGAKPVYAVYGTQSQDVLEATPKGINLFYSYDNIEGDALSHFAALAASELYQAIGLCVDDSECARVVFEKGEHFDSSGVLHGKLILKRIEDGKFVAAQE